MEWKVYSSHGCPCKECPEREIGCHGQCEKYAAWRVGVDKAREEERKYHAGNNSISERKLRAIWRSQRWRSQNTKRSRANSDR